MQYFNLSNGVSIMDTQVLVSVIPSIGCDVKIMKFII